MTGTSLGRDTLRLLLCRAAGYVLALINSVVLARALGVERLGTYAYAMGLASLFGLVPNLGINSVVTRTIARDPEAGGGVLRAGLRAQVVLAGGVLIVIPAFAAILPGQPVPIAYVALAAAQMVLGTLSWPYLALLGGRTRYDRVARVEFLSAVVGTVTLLGAVALRGGVAAVLLAHLLAAGICVALTRRAARPLFPARVGPEISLGALLRQAGPFGAALVLQSIYTRLDVLLLGQMAPASTLGLYNVAYKPTNMLVNLGSTVAGPVFPVMAQAPQGGTPMAFQRAVRGLSVAGPALALALTGMALPFLRGLYGGEYGAAAPVLGVLAWSAAANWLYAPLGMALQARGQERRWLRCLALALLVNAAANVWAIPRWGALGAAGATLASEVTLVVAGTLLLWRTLGIQPSPRRVLVGLGSMAAGGTALWALRGAGPVTATTAALAVYGAFLVLFRVVTAEDTALVLGWVRQAAPGSSRA